VGRSQAAPALDLAARALARRDFSERGLRDRLVRAGVDPGELEEAITTLRETGLLDDERFAAGRAQALAGRGKGDAAIRFDLARQGVGSEAVATTLAGLEPEAERAERLIARLGQGPKTARLLAGRGFSAEAIERASEASVAPDW
jgi:SOS response regulatory protein OraA/RecX